MYKIIGGDGKEYGPIDAVQLRQWIAEGRISAQTMVQPDGGTDWKPLSAFPDFSAPSALSNSAPAPVFAGDNRREAALQAVKGPAIALIVVSILNVFFGVWGLIQRQASMEIYKTMPQFSDPQMQKILAMANGPIVIASSLLTMGMTVVILLGALKMQQLKSHSFAFTVSILAMIPCLTPCCLLGLPFGIWALVILNKPEVKSQFN